jgi:hypothetical protein
MISGPAWVVLPIPPRIKFRKFGSGRDVALIANEVRTLLSDLDCAFSIALEAHGYLLVETPIYQIRAPRKAKLSTRLLFRAAPKNGAARDRATPSLSRPATRLLRGVIWEIRLGREKLALARCR